MSITETIGGAERKTSVRFLSTIFANGVGITWHHSAGTEMTPKPEERAGKENSTKQKHTTIINSHPINVTYYC